VFIFSLPKHRGDCNLTDIVPRRRRINVASLLFRQFTCLDLERWADCSVRHMADILCFSGHLSSAFPSAGEIPWPKGKYTLLYHCSSSNTTILVDMA
jgi:hypothetical protein